MVAFSTTDRDSFEAVEGWIRKVEAEVGKIPMVLIQNKVCCWPRAFCGLNLAPCPPASPSPTSQSPHTRTHTHLPPSSPRSVSRQLPGRTEGVRQRGGPPSHLLHPPALLAQVDIIDQAVMTKEEAEALADKVKLKFYRTSVQENFNVTEGACRRVLSPTPRPLHICRAVAWRGGECHRRMAWRCCGRGSAGGGGGAVDVVVGAVDVCLWALLCGQR